MNDKDVGPLWMYKVPPAVIHAYVNRTTDLPEDFETLRQICLDPASYELYLLTTIASETPASTQAVDEAVSSDPNDPAFPKGETLTTNH